METKKTNQEAKSREQWEETPSVTASSDEHHDPHEEEQSTTLVRELEDEHPVSLDIEEQSQLTSEEQGLHDRREDDEERLTIPEVLPVLPLKDVVVYPFAVQPLAVGQERSI